jgi:prevent-host-death family protein
MPTRWQWLAGSGLGEKTLFHGGMDHADRLSVIRVLIEGNPKKGQSAERFALYRDGMTVAEYLTEVVALGESEKLALDDLCWDQNRLYIRVEPPKRVWTVAEAKAKLSEILRLARAGEPQTIGTEEPCVVVSAEQYARYFQPEHLGRFLIESAPNGYELELPSRASLRGDPFADDEGGRAA